MVLWEVERPDRPLVAVPDAQGIPILPVPAGMPPLPPKMKKRRMYVTSTEGLKVVRRVHKCTHGVGPTYPIQTLAGEGFKN